MRPDGQIRDPRQLELLGTLLTELQGRKARSGPGDVHRVSMLNGSTYVGTWEEIVRQMKDDAAEWARSSLEQYMVGGAPGTQGDRRRHSRDRSGELHPRKRGRGATPHTALAEGSWRFGRLVGV